MDVFKAIYYLDVFWAWRFGSWFALCIHSAGLEPLSFEGVTKALRIELPLKSLCQRQKCWERKLDPSKNWRCKNSSLITPSFDQPCYCINPQAVLVSLLQRFEFKAKEPSRRIPVKSNVNTCDMLKKHRFYKDNARRETIQVSHIFILCMSLCHPHGGNTKIW